MGMIPKTQATKENIDRLDFIKIKNLCASKETIKKVRRQPVGENICKYISDKDLLSRIYKEFLKLNNNKNNTIQKMSKAFE